MKAIKWIAVAMFLTSPVFAKWESVKVIKPTDTSPEQKKAMDDTYKTDKAQERAIKDGNPEYYHGPKK